MQENGDTGEGAVRVSLAEALTFHASFDHGPEADFGLGDRRIYSVTVENGQETGELMPGLGQPALTIAEGQGRFGSALEFTRETSHVVLFKAARNVAYSEADFGGTASFWMSVDPAEIPERYCDPFQLTDKDYSDACIWVDFTKNDTPPDFRLGCFGNQREWDVTGQWGRSEEFFFRLAKVAEPPFAKGQWTHVAITWNGLNTPQPGTPVPQRRVPGRDEPGGRALHVGRRAGRHSPRDGPLRRPLRRPRLLQSSLVGGRGARALRVGAGRRGVARALKGVLLMKRRATTPWLVMEYVHMERPTGCAEMLLHIGLVAAPLKLIPAPVGIAEAEAGQAERAGQ